MGCFIHNASFMLAREREPEFLTWLGAELTRLHAGTDTTGDATGRDGLLCHGGRVTAMREAGGVDYRQAEAQTVAWQCEFPSIEAARDWNARVFASLAARFEEHFGPEAMVFTSIFETIDI